METFYAEDEFCFECGYEGPLEKAFENLWDRDDNISQIIFICPQCGSATLRGECVSGQEFFY